MKIFTRLKTKDSLQWGSFAVPIGELNLFDRILVSGALLGVMVWTFPHLAFAQTVHEMPLMFEINNLQLLDSQEDYFGRALAQNYRNAVVPDPRIGQLRAYLESKKNSPLAQNAELLFNQYHYRLIIGISFAESNFCQYQIMPNNCWGIGGGRPERYPTLADGIIRANNLIQKYQELGMTSPELMRDSWVGWKNYNWVIAVKQIILELEEAGL